MSRTTMTGRIQQRRNRRQFERALRTASPAMYQELVAAATRSTDVNR